MDGPRGVHCSVTSAPTPSRSPGWAPGCRDWTSLPRRGEIGADLLRPGGRWFLRDGHPMLWATDDRRDEGLLVVAHPYLPRPEPTKRDEDGTDISTDQAFVNARTVEWSHGLGRSSPACSTPD